MNKQEEQIDGKGIGGFGMIPDFVTHLGLSPEALCLYVHYKSVVHEGDRQCTKSTRTLCQESRLSAEKVRKAKKELIKHSLIGIEEQIRKDGGRSSDKVTVLNVWERNVVPPTTEKRSRVGKAEYPTTEKPTYPTSETPPQSQSDSSESILSERGAPAQARPPRKPNEIYSLAQILGEVCGMVFDKNKGRLLKEAKALQESAESLRQYYGPDSWWYQNDWRGKKGEKPTPATIRETWGRWNDKEYQNGRNRSQGNPAIHGEEAESTLAPSGTVPPEAAAQRQALRDRLARERSSDG